MISRLASSITRSSFQPLRHSVFKHGKNIAMFSSDVTPTVPIPKGTLNSSTTTSTSTQTAVEQTPDGQIETETITQIVSHYVQEPVVIGTFGIYSIGVFMKYGFESYNLGKLNLVEYRASPDYNPSLEYKAIVEGCRQACFLNAIIWPYTLAGEIMPFIVSNLNPPPKNTIQHNDHSTNPSHRDI